MLRELKRSLFTSAVGVGVLVMGAVSAHADIIPTLDRIESDPDGFRWTYTANLTVDSRAEAGDFFTIYDFMGFVPGTNQQPGGWTFSFQNVGVTPTRVVPDDNPGIVNLTWTLESGTISGPEALGEFSAVSVFGDQQLGWFAARTTNATGGLADGTQLQNVGQVAVPIPLPAAALMFPLGALVAGLAYRRMKR